MKKYIVKYKKDDKFFGEYKSYDEALKDLIKFSFLDLEVNMEK